MKKEYEINASTLVILPIEEEKCRVYEYDRDFIVKRKSTKIINDSCMFFGSSLNGRQYGTKKLINVAVKAPIIIEESKKIIFFPTTSPRQDNCTWISFNNLVKYEKNEDKTILTFKNNKQIELDLSYNIVDNQIVRCIKLVKAFIKRKKII